MLPRGARLLNLRDGSKIPAGVTGHLGALPLDEFVQIGENIGLALDNAFVVVDIDRPDCTAARSLSERVQALGPWEQSTPRGTHFLLRVPSGWTGTNVSLKDPEGVPYGDIKTKGYIVGPGSIVSGVTYQVTNPVEPPMAPDWLLGLAKESGQCVGSRQSEDSDRPGIPYGEHDRFLYSLACYLRGREGLSKAAIVSLIEHGPLSILMEEE